MWPTQRIPGITLAKSKNCWHQIWITKLKFLADEMFNYVWRENKGCLSSSFDCGKFECVLCCEYLTPPTDPSLWTVIALWGWVGYLGDTCCLIFLHIFKTDQITKVEKAVFTAHNMWLKCITYMSTIAVSHLGRKTKRTLALAGALYAVMCNSSSGAAPNYALKVKNPFDCQGYSTFTPTRNASWSWWYLNVVFVSTLSVSVSA